MQELVNREDFHEDTPAPDPRGSLFLPKDLAATTLNDQFYFIVHFNLYKKI
jgi:hypothetical protein